MDEFEVIGGRQLYQWDTDRSIEVRLCDGETVNEVHYAHAEDDIAPVVKVQDYDGRMFADIPNILLQRFGTLKVWAVVYTEDGRQTLRNAYLSVRARAKPDDYVYTETEIMDYRKVAEDLAELVQRVEEIEENGVQGGGAVASVNGKTGEVYLNAADVGALPTTGGKLTGNLTVPRLISTAADADGNIYEVQLYPTANGGLYMPLRHNGAVANAMSMSQSATTFGKPVAISSGGHGGKNAAEGRQNLSLYSKEEIDEKITNTQKEIERLTEEIAPLKETLSQFPSIPTAASANRYNPALQTDDTISPHYYVSGVPYSTTQFDGSYNCTAPIDIEGGKTYSIAIVPAFVIDGVEKTVPWGKAGECVFFYDADGNYLSKSGNGNTFTTPDNAKSVRFNYCTKSMGLGLATLNQRCVLVEGTIVPTTYIPYVEPSYITYADLVPQIPARIYYAIFGNSIQVVTKYNAECDLVTKLGEQVGNGLFDFKGFGVIANTGAYVSNQPDVAVTLQTIVTDTHAPFQVKADANADGDNLDGENFKQHFTGGAHQYNNQGSGSTATARLVSVEFIADGVKKTNVDGYCNHLEIRWTNHVQGYNTTKADGTGREILQENHRLVFDGHVWKSYVELVALENITINLWYGFQLSNLSGTVRYVGGANRGAYATTEASNCGNNTAVRLINEDTDKAHRFEMCLNRAVDLGGGSENTNTPNNGLFASSYGKSYFRVIDGAFALADGETAYIEGEYRFTAN